MISLGLLAAVVLCLAGVRVWGSAVMRFEERLGRSLVLWGLVAAAAAVWLAVFVGYAPAQPWPYGPYDPMVRPPNYYVPRGPIPRSAYEGRLDSYRPWYPFPRSRRRYPDYIGRGAMWGYPTMQRRGWRW